MPLTMAPRGSAATVKKINGKDEIRRFLKSLGFVEGEVVTVVSELGGNLIVSRKDTPVALSKPDLGLTGGASPAQIAIGALPWEQKRKSAWVPTRRGPCALSVRRIPAGAHPRPYCRPRGMMEQ